MIERQLFKTATDQMGKEIRFSFPPRRIISLVPSQTEFLFDIGLEDEIVGITKFCVHPKDKVKGKNKIGGTKRFNFKAIDSLRPDLIIGNKEENYQEGIEKLQGKYPVWMSDISNLEQAYQMMQSLGRLTGKEREANHLVEKIKKEFQALDQQLAKKVLYLIWQDPYMSVGDDTFIHHLLEQCGFENVLIGKKRYPVLSPEEIRDYRPDLILLSTEPYPFKEKHVAGFQALFPHTDIAIVDGELFSWYGSRLQYSPAYFKEIRNRLLR